MYLVLYSIKSSNFLHCTFDHSLNRPHGADSVIGMPCPSGCGSVVLWFCAVGCSFFRGLSLALRSHYIPGLSLVLNPSLLHPSPPSPLPSPQKNVEPPPVSFFSSLKSNGDTIRICQEIQSLPYVGF